MRHGGLCCQTEKCHCRGRGILASVEPPQAWPEVPSQRPEPLNSSQRSPGNSVSVFTPAVSASESFILTADCIKIPVVIGSGAVFSMRILNQAFCPRPERSVSEYKDAGDGITQGIFPPLNFPPILIMAALYLLPNKLGRPPLPQFVAKGKILVRGSGRLWGCERGSQAGHLGLDGSAQSHPGGFRLQGTGGPRQGPQQRGRDQPDTALILPIRPRNGHLGRRFGHPALVGAPRQPALPHSWPQGGTF